MAYIIDTYDKYDAFDRQQARYVFEVNERWYAIKEVRLKWGRPQLPLSLYSNKDEEPYQIYETFEEAMGFVHTMKGLN